MPFASDLSSYRALVEQGLSQMLPAAEDRPTRLHAAMRYSVEAGGKRVRPVLVLAAAELLGATAAQAVPAAVALECIHTYSLIHDDLPCMDDDDLRRGRPTAHRAFDEATALLAGDALLTLAFELLAASYAATPELAIFLVRELAVAAGSRHLIGGQMEDLLAEGRNDLAAADLHFIHANKTAALISAALAMGGAIGVIAAGGRLASDASLAGLRATGAHVGLAFQINDDILDATTDAKTLGKTPGKDAKADKTTFLKIHGLEKSCRLAAEETASALRALPAGPGDPAFLREMINQLAQRKS